MKRASGVLMHISSLWGDYSIGSFGKEAIEFVDFLSQCGFSYWQVLPFSMIDECNSPYKSYSAFGGNPYFVDLPTLRDEGLLTFEETESARQQTPYSCEYVRLYHTRVDLLRLAAMRADAGLKNKISEFMAENPYLAQFAEFMALKSSNNEKCWIDWTNQTPDAETLYVWQFIQYKFYEQWSKIKNYANSKGIRIIGDIPIYVSYDSADVWGNKELFQLYADGTPSSVAGVPPDYFAADGQLWGNPLYNWDAMAKDGYAWWVARMENMFKLFDGVRIDHFRAIESYWSVDAKETTARNGKWVKGPGKSFVDRINEIKGDKLIIAEDLGMITNEVTELVNYSGFPGMRVLQFGFLDDGDNPHKPHNYPNNSVAYTGTHDNNTLLGYVWELGDSARASLMEYCGHSGDWNCGYDSIVRTIYASNAGLVILPIQDLLGYGSDTRLNIPGKADGNWQFRITRSQLGEINTEKYKRLNFIYKR
ncbi:MAG: 4-alpha-glucanotransferase [Ruminococcaceae bacterium]|nr:4-alpha-glucanotransferase [Oscillospiraceae bacterium]